MLAHISIGVRDIARSKGFYDAALAPLGYACRHQGDDLLGYGGEAGIDFWLNRTATPAPANAASGLHFCFDAASHEAVGKFHAAALAAGGNDNGGPGLRPEYGPNYYAAFAIDPDGYRIEAYCGR